MKVEEAKKVLEEKKKLETDRREALQVLEAEQIRKQGEEKRAKQEAEKQKKAEFEAKLPKKFCEVTTKCWNCSKKLVMNNDRTIQSNIRGQGLVRINECEGCKCFTLDFCLSARPKDEDEVFRSYTMGMVTKGEVR